MREKRLTILWNFNGKVYFGGWDRGNMMTEGNKHGIGLEWVPSSINSLIQDIYIMANSRITRKRATEL